MTLTLLLAPVQATTSISTTSTSISTTAATPTLLPLLLLRGVLLVVVVLAPSNRPVAAVIYSPPRDQTFCVDHVRSVRSIGEVFPPRLIVLLLRAITVALKTRHDPASAATAAMDPVAAVAAVGTVPAANTADSNLAPLERPGGLCTVGPVLLCHWFVPLLGSAP